MIERSRLGFLLLFLTVFLWTWLTFPWAQVSALYRLHQFAEPAAADLYFLHMQQGLMVPYYQHLLWGALLLSLVGPLLIWLLPRKLAREPILSLTFGLLVGILLGHLLVGLVAPNDPRARIYPVDPTYFMFGSAMAGTIAGYLKVKTVDEDAARKPHSRELHFLAEGVIAWLAVLQLLATYWLVGPERTQGLGSAEAQVAFVVPALAWTWVCPLFLWRRRPKTRLRSILWSTLIALVISKVAGVFLTGLGVLARSGAMMASWAIGYIGEGGQFDILLVFGPSLIWGLIMGLRRWQYLRAEQKTPDIAGAPVWK